MCTKVDFERRSYMKKITHEKCYYLGVVSVLFLETQTISLTVQIDINFEVVILTMAISLYISQKKQQ